MPKNPVTDPITDQEIAFARLILSGTMNDRRAAEAVGLNPETAAYTKAKPRVRAYMIEHRAAVKERLVDQEADGLRRLNLGRDQILTRLWELATLSHEATRGTIAGQIKALSMIVAIEGLVPSGMNARRFSPPAAQPAAPPVEAHIHTADWLCKQQHDPHVKTQAIPLPPRKPNPPHRRSHTRSLHQNLQPSRPRNRLTVRRSPTSTRNQPTLSIPLSSPKP
jgi:hypothetical protein